MLKRIFPRYFKRKYLLQLAATSVLLLLVPCLLALTFLFNQSYQQMVAADQEYYSDMLSRFGVCFETEISELRLEASQLALDTRDTQKPISLLGRLDTNENNYYYWEAIGILKDYALSGSRDVCVYYYDDDVLLSTVFRYTSSSFISERVESKQIVADQSALLASFLLRENAYSGMTFAGKDCLLIGFPARLGTSRRNALIIYQLDLSDFMLSQFYGTNSVSLIFCVYDSDGRLLLSTSAVPEDMSTLDAAQAYSEALTSSSSSSSFYTQDGPGGRTYAVSVQLDEAASGMMRFFFQIRGILGLTLAALLLLTCAVVYVNYRPINQIMHQLPQSGTGDEISDISLHIARMNSEMSEQKLLLMDYLLNNLICGAPIPVGELDKIGISQHAGHFSVMTLFNHNINTQVRVELTDLLLKKFGVQVFITDILGRDHTVIIMLLPSPDVEELNDFLHAYLTTHVSYPLSLSMGTVVSSINKICSSYRATLEENSRYEEEPGEETNSQILLLKDEILKYLQQNYTDPDLSQISVADMFGISTYSLSRLFKKHVGVGFSEYITAKRLESAKHLLLHTEKSVGDIASEIGIASSNYFSRLFKANVGVTPLKYRAAQGELLAADDE